MLKKIIKIDFIIKGHLLFTQFYEINLLHMLDLLNPSQMCEI